MYWVLKLHNLLYFEYSRRKCWVPLVIQYMYYNMNNNCSIGLLRTHELFYVGISDESEGGVRYPCQKQFMCAPQMDWTLVCGFITYYIFDVDLIDFCRFTLGAISYNKVVSAMWSPFRDHIAGYHIKRSNKLWYLLAKTATNLDPRWIGETQSSINTNPSLGHKRRSVSIQLTRRTVIYKVIEIRVQISEYRFIKYKNVTIWNDYYEYLKYDKNMGLGEY